MAHGKEKEAQPGNSGARRALSTRCPSANEYVKRTRKAMKESRKVHKLVGQSDASLRR